MEPILSVVIPAYNNQDFIAETMRSVLEQTHGEFELIVADHASSDNTLEILRTFESDPRVRILLTEAGGGAVRNWNRVTEEARGTYIKLVCGDDILDPTCLEKQLAAFEPGVDMVAARRDIMDADGRPIMKGRGLPGLIGRFGGRTAIKRTVREGTNVFGEPASVMFRREALAAAGNWDPDEHFLLDEATYASVLVNGDFVGVPDSLGSFRVSGGQWSVRLAKSQADEAVSFHKKLAALHPGLLSRTDLLIGNARARLMAIGRRVVYIWLASRMVKEPE